ncbi:poly-gamma-glutamate biosynthesis protein PgsC/CapC [Actinophytocola oryzae]|uniref:Poly-gamma-glutamate biosynthesis protein PgsC/CapC n=1 Tax=Actinophytocola oryzae TaxID=502181 RepID=A0A4R7VHH5_9PSEU|nr:poly-gamma-glutamate biosynthesis protein PgsC/CapC [Actinophytocola oryzae]TDV48782.1 poly-gamma-glutamate biosynthesis protein PgsC/CapC [Actinophytocola oryzae]
MLSAEVAVLGIAIGVVFSLVCYLVSNLSPGGMVTPGWLGLALVTDPRKLWIIAGVTVATYLGARLLQRLVILYGKRLFAAVLLLGVFLQLTVFLFLSHRQPMPFPVRTLGFVVPGLIAYQCVRQPVASTLLATAAVTMLSYVVLLTGVLLNLLPPA